MSERASCQPATTLPASMRYGTDPANAAFGDDFVLEAMNSTTSIKAWRAAVRRLRTARA